MKPNLTARHLLEAHQFERHLAVYKIIERIDAIEKQIKTKEPLFVATVNTHGQIVVPIRVRDKLGLTTDSKVAVYHIDKVE